MLIEVELSSVLSSILRSDVWFPRADMITMALGLMFGGAYSEKLCILMPLVSFLNS